MTALAAVLITVGAIAAVWVALLRCPCETAAGGLISPPADGAAPTAGPSMPAAAPAPSVPGLPRGAAGVLPTVLALLTPDDPRLPVDPVDADVADWVALLPGVAPVGGAR